MSRGSDACTSLRPCAAPLALQSELRHLALSDLDRRILVLFYCFNVSNTFLGSVLGGAVFQQIGSMVQEPGAGAGGGTGGLRPGGGGSPHCCWLPAGAGPRLPCTLAWICLLCADGPATCTQPSRESPPRRPPSPAGHWLAQLGTSLPTASTYFLNYIIIHTLSTNFFRFIWCARRPGGRNKGCA